MAALRGCGTSAEPAAQAHALLERLFALLHDCRALGPKLEPGGERQESASAQAERLLYFALVGALEAGLVPHGRGCPDRAAPGEPAAGPMGAEWLKRQEREL